MGCLVGVVPLGGGHAGWGTTWRVWRPCLWCCFTGDYEGAARYSGIAGISLGRTYWLREGISYTRLSCNRPAGSSALRDAVLAGARRLGPGWLREPVGYIFP